MRKYYDTKKVVIVGCGAVGMSYAYALLNQNICNELVLIDINEKRSQGEAMDLNHGLAFSSTSMRIKSGTYEDCKDADIVCICAGVAQQSGETRIALLRRNTAVFESIIMRVRESGFDGIYIVATNPVDVMTKITYVLSGAPSQKVIGTGTMLDTARLRYLLGDYFHVDPRNVHAYVMGEHGESEFVPWSQAMVGTKKVTKLCEESNGAYCTDFLAQIEDDVRFAAYKIIEAKGATCYGIGMSLARLTRAIFDNEQSILTVSTLIPDKGVYIGVPAVIDRGGVRNIVDLELGEEEIKKFNASADFLHHTYEDIAPKFV